MLLQKTETEERGSILYPCPKIYSWKQLSQQHNKYLFVSFQQIDMLQQCRWHKLPNTHREQPQRKILSAVQDKYSQHCSSLSFPHVPTTENRQFGMYEIHFAPWCIFFFFLSVDKNHKQCRKTIENTTSPVCLSWSMQGCPSFGE